VQATNFPRRTLSRDFISLQRVVSVAFRRVFLPSLESSRSAGKQRGKRMVVRVFLRGGEIVIAAGVCS
jgi:hypothetical protein